MDEWSSQERFLDQGNEREKWRRCYSWTSFASNPHIDRFADRLPCFIPREQFGNRYAITLWWFWNKIDVLDSFFTFFPYLLIHRTEEIEGSNPSRTTKIHAYSPSRGCLERTARQPQKMPWATNIAKDKKTGRINPPVFAYYGQYTPSPILFWPSLTPWDWTYGSAYCVLPGQRPFQPRCCAEFAGFCLAQRANSF